MSRGRKHRRHGGKKYVKLAMSQLIDFDRPGELVAVIRDLETDEVLKTINLGALAADCPVLLSLQFNFLPEQETE